MFAQMNLTCCWPAPTTCLHSRKVISRLKRSATIPRMSATLAEVSVQKYARQPVGSSTSTTRITPPAGRQVARNVLYRLTTFTPYSSKVSEDQPRRWPARLARSITSGP